jgi:hypothetical protein
MQGPSFGKLICTEILIAFVEEYSSDLGSGSIGHNLRDFHGFHNKIAEVIKNSVRPVLGKRKLSASSVSFTFTRVCSASTNAKGSDKSASGDGGLHRQSCR